MEWSYRETVWRHFMKKLLLVVILPEFADWEAAFLTAAVKSIDYDYQIKYVGIEPGLCTSIGGLHAAVDYTIENAPADFSGLVLTGGNSWRTQEAEKVMKLVHIAVNHAIPIGAICDATVFLGAHGILNNVKHTSNALTELKSYAKERYNNENEYVDEQAVADNTIITANGTAALEFTKLMLEALHILQGKQVDDYYYFMKNGLYESLKRGIDIPFR